MKNPLFVNKKVWNEFSDEEMAKYKEDVFNHYRSSGFPHFNLTKDQLGHVFKKMEAFDYKSIEKDDDVISQNMLGLNLVNHYMPHMWSTRCRGFKTPTECFDSDEFLRKAITKRVQIGDNMSDAGMRKALSWTHGTHRVSNFRPTVAKYIYERYGNAGKVLDFSMGYGGRLLGALTSNIESYTGFDPCVKTYQSLVEIGKNFNKGSDGTKFTLINDGFEKALEYNDFFPCAGFDLAFSSPPYFNTEEYSDEKTQSWVSYKTKEEWAEKFLRKSIQNIHALLKDSGTFALNIANVKTYKDLEVDSVRIAEECGFKLIRTHKMALSSLMSSGFKYEPIFIFEKC